MYVIMLLVVFGGLDAPLSQKTHDLSKMKHEKKTNLHHSISVCVTAKEEKRATDTYCVRQLLDVHRVVHAASRGGLQNCNLLLFSGFQRHLMYMYIS